MLAITLTKSVIRSHLGNLKNRQFKRSKKAGECPWPFSFPCQQNEKNKNGGCEISGNCTGNMVVGIERREAEIRCLEIIPAWEHPKPCLERLPGNLQGNMRERKSVNEYRGNMNISEILLCKRTNSYCDNSIKLYNMEIES